MEPRKCWMCEVLVNCLLSLCLPAVLCAAQGNAHLVLPTLPPCSADIRPELAARFQLTPSALQSARIIGVQCEVARLLELIAADGPTRGRIRSLEELSLRQVITDAVVAASLDIDSALGEIDFEQKQIYEIIRLSQTRHDRALGTTNLAVLTVSTGLGIVAGAMSFSDATSDLGDALGFASGGISTLFSIRGLRQSKEKGLAEGVLPNMLDPFFADPGSKQRLYAEVVWTYMNSVPPGEHDQSTRKEQLLEQWDSEGRLQIPGSIQSQQRIALLTTTQAATKKLDISVLTERSAMLADAGHAVAQMKHDLADLLRSLR